MYRPTSRIVLRSILALACLALLAPLAAQAAEDEFPRPPELEPAIRFWTKIYTQVSTDGGLLHDRHDLSIVYEQMRFEEGVTRRQRSREVRERKKYYRRKLLEIVGSDRENLSRDAARILELWPNGVSDARLERAAYNIRFQLGQSDKFRAGLVRSGKWEPHIRRTLKEMGLPEELAALPHVESSFNPNAWSRVGAAGLWQFTRLTGRRYMRIDHVVDERMDPFKSSVAAARLLEHNYSVTKSWALALTAYNHGLAGIRRAARQVGTKNIARIAEEYRSRTWGFASRNFYPAFLAAVEVDFHAHKYFGMLDRDDPVISETIELPFYASPRALADAFRVDIDRLRDLNRALRDPIWEGNKRVPRGYELRVPAGPERPPASELLANVAKDERFYAQIPDRYHRVRRGEALSTIARRYNVSTRELVSLNNLRSQHYIRAGQTLRLPVPAETGREFAADGTYTVRRGDTLSGIAQRVGMSTTQLASINGLSDRHRIYPGQELDVASSGTQVADASGASAGGSADAAEQSGSARATSTAEAASATAADDSASSAAASDEEAAQAGEAEPEQTVVADASDTTGDAGQAQAEAPSDAAIATASAAATGGEDTDAGAEEDALAPADAETRAEDARLAEAGQAEADRVVLTAGVPAGSRAAQVATAAEQGGSGMPGSASPTEAHDLTADPSDYGVADDETIEVQAAETLGHYAEWLDLRASQLRRINGMRYGKPVVIGKRLKLDFSRVSTDEFEERRLAYHESLQARFFDQFRITGTKRQLIERGDSLWTLSRRSDNVPVWLLRQYNPDLDFTELKPGMPVTLPIVERQAQSQEAEGDARAEVEGQADQPGA